MIGTDLNAIRKFRLFFASQLFFIACFQFLSMNTQAQTTIAGPKGRLAARAAERTGNFKASFSYQPVFPIEGQTVQFVDASVGDPTSWLWDFGDGSTSTGRNPQHIYKNTGFQRVTLLVSNSTGYSKAIKTFAVFPASAAKSDIASILSASFAYAPTSPIAGQTVQFTDTSAGAPASWKWTFGDGSSSTVQNPAHNFENAGFFDVALTVTRGNETKSVSRTVTIVPSSAPQSSFTFSPSSPVAEETVQFMDTSAGSPDSWQWDFNDGATSSQQNPSHTFAAGGSYNVALTVANSSGSNIFSSAINVMPAPPEADGYYIDANNPKASDSNPGTAALPWKTLTKANQTLVAGDTVYIKAGTYATYVNPSNSGTAANRITYTNYGTDSVVISNAAYAVYLHGKSYITVDGINSYSTDHGLWIDGGGSYNIITNSNIDQIRNNTYWPNVIYQNACYNTVSHSRFSRWGYLIASSTSLTGSQACGNCMTIGNQGGEGNPPSFWDYSNYNLIDDCEMYYGGIYVITVAGAYNIVQNSRFCNDEWHAWPATGISYGHRACSISGPPETTHHNLFQGNTMVYSGLSAQYNTFSSAFQIKNSHNIFRHNVVDHNSRGGFSFTTSNYWTYLADVNYNKVYNNTFYGNGNYAVGFTHFNNSTHSVRYNVVKNNIMRAHTYATHSDANPPSSLLGPQYIEGNWDGDTRGDPQFVNASTVQGNPLDFSASDFHLKSISPCKDAGTYLTTITSASGSGTTFVVADAGYFIDGWGIAGVSGDTIQIFGTSQKARITKVDYKTNTITVNSALTWTKGQGLALAYLGAAPDAGAFEYGK